MGFDYAIAADISLLFVAGYSWLDREISEDESSFSGDVKLTKKLSRGALYLTGSGGFSESNFGAQTLGVNEFYEGGGSIRYQLAKHLAGKAFGSYRYDKFLERTPERERVAHEKLNQLTGSGGFRMPPGISKEDFYENIMNEIFGFGPIQALINQDGLTEIMVNGPYIIFVEMKGRLSESGYKFLDDDHVERIIKRIVLPLGRVANQSKVERT